MDAFDIVVIGGGSGGSAAAGRLSEDGKYSVCVIEAGGTNNSWRVIAPGMLPFLPKPSNWRFDTVPQKGLNGRTGYQPRGKGLGGSSAVNAMLYVRGCAWDYDNWDALGAKGWSYKDVLPVFRRAEGNVRGADDYHGADGPLSVSDQRWPNPGSVDFVEAVLNETKPVRSIQFSKEELVVLKPLCLITAKPAMFVGNVSEDGFDNNPYLDRLREYAARQNAPVVAICAKMEAEMADMSDEDKQMFLSEIGQEEPGLNRLIRAGFKLLGLQTYFTAGVKEVRAWTIHIGDTAPQAAGVIHTDFERGFIRAQTIAFDDYIQYKGEAGAKDAGKMRSEGKEYVVKDGDVLNFLFNV